MTPAEHELIQQMFLHQTLAIKSLIESLKSQGFVHEGDISAYVALFESRPAVLQALELQVRADYREFGRAAGVRDFL